MNVVFIAWWECRRTIENTHNSLRADFPHLERSAAHVHIQPATGPVAHAGVLGRLARNLALRGVLRDSLHAKSAED